MLTTDQLMAIAGISQTLTDKWIDAINSAMENGQITTCLRQSAFLSQVLLESGCFRYVREIWGPTAAQRRYEGREDLGNIYQGDGFKFRGRGLIQVTGRANYEACGQALGINLIDMPELLEQPEYAVASAVWYWNSNGINDIADNDDIKKVTRAVNGGYNGLEERTAYYNKAKEQLGC